MNNRLNILYSAVVLITMNFASANEYSAKLKGHAFIPADTYISAPENAPQDLKISGKFTQNFQM